MNDKYKEDFEDRVLRLLKEYITIGEVYWVIPEGESLPKFIRELVIDFGKYLQTVEE